MIVFEKMSFGYSPRRKIHTDLSLRFDSGAGGSVYGLLGGNGMGKSTLLKLAAGLLVSQSGRVTIDGRDPAQKGVPRFRARGRHVAFTARRTHQRTRHSGQEHVPAAS